MATSLLKNTTLVLKRFNFCDQVLLLQSVRTAYTIRHRGLPPELAKSWKQIKQELSFCKEKEVLAVNIGFPLQDGTKMTRTEMRKKKQEKEEHSKRNEAELERKARLQELVVPISVAQAEGFQGVGQRRIHRLADHYGLFRDLFGEAYFYPSLDLRVGYVDGTDPEFIQPVYHGNQLPPAETQSAPEVVYKGDADKFYTLCMVAPDSHLEHNNKEYLHWMVANIPGTSVSEGQVLCDYMPVFPVHGTGNHRYAFVLYQHDNVIDLSAEKRHQERPNLTERTFETLEFYRRYQDAITPVGLCFFQAEWDPSVRKTFHSVLDMDEPRFEFLPPQEYISKQVRWPEWESFNTYLDKYRDERDIGEEVLKEKLKMASPFKPRPRRRRFPLIFEPPKDKLASWLLIREHEKRLRKSYWKYLDD